MNDQDPFAEERKRMARGAAYVQKEATLDIAEGKISKFRNALSQAEETGDDERTRRLATIVAQLNKRKIQRFGR